MSVFNDLFDLFGRCEKETVVENFHVFRYQCSLVESNLSPDFCQEVGEIFRLFISRDVGILLSVTIDAQDPINLSSENSEVINERCSELFQSLTDVELDESVEIELYIDKRDQSAFNVFNADAFSRHLCGCSLNELFEGWCGEIMRENRCFQAWDEDVFFSTMSFCFKSVDARLLESVDSLASEKARDIIISKRDMCSHFSNAAQYHLVPEDFEVISGSIPKWLEECFHVMLNSLVIIHLCNFSEVHKKTLKIRLQGYKLISEELSSGLLKHRIYKELFDVYKWTYFEGNYSDKIGLSRNVISIHLNDSSLLSVGAGTSYSVRSGYELYLKENVKQYLEIKNKISDFIHEQSERAREITKGMFSNFKTGLWTFTTFFISVFLLRVVNKSLPTSLFSFEVVVVSCLLIVVSFLYLLISLMEVNSDKNRMFDRYSEIKNRHRGLLSDEDLDKILNIDDLKNKENGYIKSKTKLYAISWACMNFLFLIIVFCLYFYSN